MQTIYLDISNKGVIPTIYAKQNEVGRKFLAVVTDGGVPYNIEESSVLSVWYEGESGKGNYTEIGEKEAISVYKNKVTVELIEQMLSVPGNGIITVLINSKNGYQIGLWNIDYCVEKVAGVESEKAEEYYTAFSKSATSLAQSAETIKEKQERIDSIIKAKNATAAGLIYPLASANVPSGFLFCDGAEYSRTEYAELFEAIGITYGAGDGETTFNVPNLQTRVPVGSGGGYELGAIGGEAEHTLTVDEMPSHDHKIQVASTTTGSLQADATIRYNSENTSFTGDGISTKQKGGGQPHNIMQPYTVVNYIISTGKEMEFVVGGGASVGLDTTLTQEGMAADAKAVGDKLGDIYSTIDNLEDMMTNTLVVTYNQGDDYASYTSVDIQNHVSNGGQVIFVYEDVKIPLTYLVEDDSAYFETYDPSARIKFSYRVWDDGAVDQSIEYLATTDRVTDQINDALGDIETALDGILAIQNQLIGGDA